MERFDKTPLLKQEAMIGSSKLLFEIICFCFAVFTILMANNVFLSIALLVPFLLLKDRFTVSLLVVLPVIETAQMITTDVTITKIISIFLGLIFLTEIIVQGKFFFDRGFVYLLFVFSMVILGLFIALTSMNFGPMIDWNYEAVISENLASISILLFTAVFYLLIRTIDLPFVVKNLSVASKSISISIITITVYFVTHGNMSFKWSSTITRLSFTNADPNNYASMLAILSVFALYLIYSPNSKAWSIVGIISYVAAFYSVYLTFSRGGLLTFIFALVLSTLTFARKDKGRLKVIFFVLLFLIIIIVLFKTGMISSVALYERFFGKSSSGSLSNFTSGRSDLWKAGLSIIWKRPVFGFGGSYYSSMFINLQEVGMPLVFHNLFLEILVQYGLVGFTIFFLIIVRTFRGYVLTLRFYKRRGKDSERILLLPFICLFTGLFAGLSLSWQWKEMLWYFIAICLGTTDLLVMRQTHEKT